MKEKNGLPNNDEMIPLKFYLSRNYPNPFRNNTRIKYCVAYKTKIEITIHNKDKKVIKKLVNNEHEAGTYEIEFDGNNLTEGIYYCRLKADNYLDEKKMEKI